METKIKEIMKDYNKHALDILPTTIFTVMAWMSAQALIEEFMKAFAPDVQRWQLALIELFIASFGLWFVTRNGKKKEKEVDNGTSELPAV